MPSFKMKLVGRRRTLPLPIYQDLSKSSSRRRSKGSQYALTALEIHLSPPSKVLRTTSSSNTRVTKSVPDSIVFWSSRIIMLPSCTKFKPRVTATRKHLRSLRNFTSCSDMKFTDQTPLVCLQHPAKFFKVAGECNDYIKQPDGHKPPEPPDSDYHDIHRGQREAGGGFAWLSFRYLLNVDKVNWIISVTDVGQHVHFDMVFNFGMLIEYPFERFPNWEELGEHAIGDLQAFYKESKQKFDVDPVIKERAQQAVVRLQGGENRYRKAWTQFDKVYQRLKVHLEEKGESFYNPHIPDVLEKLSHLIEESEGARVIFFEGKNIPLIVVKSDGGYNYASLDLAALWYLLNVEKVKRIIYVTDVGQEMQFDTVFSASKLACWLPAEQEYPKTSHMVFGLVLGDDGKRFRTRSSEVVRLVDLLDEAKNCSKDALIERGKAAEWTAEELEQTAEAVGYGAVKYADLKNNRLTNYTFNFDQMLSDKTGEVVLDHVDERGLGLHLLQFTEVVEEACTNLLHNLLCEYLYNLSENFTKFYTNCQVVGISRGNKQIFYYAKQQLLS